MGLLQIFKTTLNRLFRRSASFGAPALEFLTPAYDPEQHGIYVEALERALSGREAKEVRNIALTGSYGVGKSSILKEVSQRHSKRLIRISLSSLGLEATSDLSKTNQIQKEIVKQLLYGQDPVKMPGSRYRRTTRFRFWRELALAATFGLPLGLIFFVVGWSSAVGAKFGFADDVSLAVGATVAVALVSLLLLYRFFFHYQFQIGKLGAVGASIELTKTNETFFDEFLDEIVYFFDVVDRDIVVFEDIDRFGDAHIFETLRSLNTLLNSANQLRGRQIRFVYAIKDSIFEQVQGTSPAMQGTGSDATAGGDLPAVANGADKRLERANRTKFFDLVIPVIPFISHRNARDLLRRTMDTVTDKLDVGLLDIVGRYVADMRMIKNIRNEFAMYKKRIIDDGSLELDENALFAMVVYKNLRLTDFEHIRFGTSALDSLYQDSRDIVEMNIEAINPEIRSIRHSLDAARATTLDAETLGTQLDEYIRRLVTQFGARETSREAFGQQFDQATSESSEFWESLADADASVTVAYWINNSSYGRGTLTLTREDLEREFKRQIRTESWFRATRAPLEARLAEAEVDRDLLLYADMNDLVDRDDFKFSPEEGEWRSLAESIELYFGDDATLVTDLTRRGFITRNFALYSSTFYGTFVTANAMNFTLKNIERNTIDTYFVLEQQDVEAILHEQGDGILDEKPMLNVRVIDYLAEKRPDGLDRLARQIARGGDDAKKVVSAYLDTGAKQTEFISALTEAWPGTLTYLVDELDLDQERQLEVVDDALLGASGQVKYTTSDGVRQFIEEHSGSLQATTTKGGSSSRDAAMEQIIVDAGAIVTDLRPLSESLRKRVVTASAYILTRDNLICALDVEETDLTLEAIKRTNVTVYAHVLRALETYLGVLSDSDTSMHDQSHVVEILNDIAEDHAETIVAVWGHAIAGLSVTDIAELKSSAWEPTASACGFTPNFHNVSLYVNELGFDSSLADFLASVGEIVVESDDDMDERTALAISILNGQDVLPSAETRVELAKSLELDQVIAVASLHKEDGDFVGRLLGAELIADDATAFTILDLDEWPGLEAAIASSTQFQSFATTTELPAKHIGPFFESSKIDGSKKVLVLDQLTLFGTAANGAGLARAAQFALSSGTHASIDALVLMATKRVAVAAILKLLEPLLPQLEASQMAALMAALGGQYQKMATRSGRRATILDLPGTLGLIQRLEALQIANGHNLNKGEYQVNMKKPS